ncbi:glutamate receptor ionotropic, kainate 2-like isoform X2 [Liolophura sinensis]|uniref:glutamate receptor ionotropic, kainate 2-like isoform X2 n=1 Tax=Liolophura sinensis TaxID=3198878 RepID=UPI003159495E
MAMFEGVHRQCLAVGIGLVNLLAWIVHGQGVSETIRVGGLFEPENEGQALAFKYAIEKLNVNNNILPQTLVIYDVQEVLTHDSFHASKKVCKQLKEGVAAIFGPMSSLSAAHVQSVCDAMEIPHVQTRWDPNDIRDYYSMNLYPHYTTLSKAYLDLITYWKWERFTILYEDNDGLIRLQELFRASQKSSLKITVRKLEAVNGNYIPILKSLRDKGESRIVVDCHVSKVFQVLKQALQVEMMSQYFHYFFTTLDLGLIDLEDFKHGGANVTAFRIVDPMNPKVRDAISDWALEEMRTGKSALMRQREMQILNITLKGNFTTETALINDAVLVFAKALNELARAQDVKTEGLSCSRSDSWKNGNSLLNYMKLMEFDGLSGPVRFDQESGLRTDFSLDIIMLDKKGLQKIGNWTPKAGVNITLNRDKYWEEVRTDLANKTLIVTSVLENPYTMEKVSDPGHNLTGNDRYEGFAVDLLKEVAKHLNFTYTIRIREDKKFGNPDDITGEWNGMVRELIDKKADLAVAGMTITYRREKVIDFTKPFLNLGITILYKKPDKRPPQLFSFLSPLSIEVWVYMLAAYLCVSFMLFVLARFSPYEWYNPHPCNPDGDVVENQFSILNSLWFTIGSLMQQGSDIAPRALSTRLVSGIWWFFTLIMISSYTANLAAFLTVERMVYPIESADDLSKQTKIKYGTLWSGSTKTFFQTSEVPTFEKMWKFMSTTKPSVFVNSTQEGVDRVLQGDYAYLAESTTIDYEVQRNCSLMIVGGLLDSKGYGIATPIGSPYRDLISEAILKLKEDGKIQQMYKKWWETKAGGQCMSDDSAKTKDANELGVANVGGVFVVLLAGLAFAMLIVICEFVWKAKKNAREDKQSVCSEMSEEFRFAIRCMGSSTKPAHKRKESENGVVDNGLHLMPLTGYTSPNRTAVPGKDVYT